MTGSRFAVGSFVLPISVHATVILACGAISMVPQPSHAFSFGDVNAFFRPKAEAFVSTASPTVQTMSVLEATVNPNPAKGGGDIIIVDDSAVVPDEGPAGKGADIEKSKNSVISIYVVREGDTLSEIAEMFGVTANTIKWANDIPPNGRIRVGQTLTILPIDGVKYVVKKGDTFESIAKKHDADADEIRNYNGLETLAIGSQIIIPDGEIEPPPAAKTVAKSIAGAVLVASSGSYTNPLPGARRTQGIHGYNGIDLAGVPVGTPIVAAAAGEIIVARSGGYNGGYGSYVVIRHDNGTQTLYAHMSSVRVGVGQIVSQGEAIGGVGNSGRSTGAHLHFEVRGAKNPF
jgi:murein DD-endopeptidase MepM/ murein hydrolase activator NlpD